MSEAQNSEKESEATGGYTDNIDSFLPKPRKPYDLLVFIGRFQPVHNAHLEVVKQALGLTDNLLILMGSSLQGDNDRTLRNPFTDSERRLMLLESIAEMLEGESSFGKVNLSIENGLTDHPDDNVWASNVNKMVDKHIERLGGDLTVGLVGCMKCHQSFWLNMFPQWELEIISTQENGLSATDIRQQYFAPSSQSGLEEFNLENCVASSVKKFLDGFKENPTYSWLSELALDRQHVLNYLEPYRGLPYPPIFVTVDVVVLWVGSSDTQLLLIRRGGRPGRGLYALPGGFVDVNETLRDAAIRELKEETGLCLNGFGTNELFITERPLVFDRPDRSQRFRTITHAFGIVIDVKDCPTVNPDDDADQAFWQSVDAIPNLFEDHNQVVLDMITELQTLLTLGKQVQQVRLFDGVSQNDRLTVEQAHADFAHISLETTDNQQPTEGEPT